ncbi:MAG TPA: hypothetical protein VNK24_05965 [Elusimicrobiota bacterium]|nr:hypothetical protein [Elusimicrobiota bacterium]
MPSNRPNAARRLKLGLLIAAVLASAGFRGARAAFRAEVEPVALALNTASLAPDFQTALLANLAGLSVAGPQSLRTSGFAVLPAGRFMGKPMEDAFNRRWRRRLAVKNRKDEALWLHSYDRESGGTRWETRSRKIQRFIARLTARLHKALPGEDFYLGNVMIQVSANKVPRAADPHIDRNLPYHLVVSYPLHRRARGTVIYKTDGGVGKAVEIPAGPRQAAVFSGIGREIATGNPATLHAAPKDAVRRRAVLLVTYLTPAVGKYDAGLVREIRRRERKLDRLLRPRNRRTASEKRP